MRFKYRNEFIIGVISLGLCLSLFVGIKTFYFHKTNMAEPLKKVLKYQTEEVNTPKYAQATTKKVLLTTTYMDISFNMPDEDLETTDEEINTPYEVAPEIVDDGSIIYDGLTLTELTNKLNKSLNGYLANTGYFFAKYTKDTGIDPYLNVAIVLLETGCKWQCSSLTVECNNIGGLKGGTSCNGRAYSKYNSLEEGIKGYLDIIYNNYYLKGMDTAEKMASKYAASSLWSQKVNTYINEVRSK